MSYTLDKHVAGDFDEIVAETIATLENEGFGVLSDIDVGATLETKLDLGPDAVSKYRILGACDPGLAHEALDVEQRLGALLPCNVIVYETETGAVAVSAVDPQVLLGVVDNPALEEPAAEIRRRLESVLDALPTRRAT